MERAHSLWFQFLNIHPEKQDLTKHFILNVCSAWSEVTKTQTLNSWKSNVEDLQKKCENDLQKQFHLKIQELIIEGRRLNNTTRDNPAFKNPKT